MIIRVARGREAVENLVPTLHPVQKGRDVVAAVAIEFDMHHSVEGQAGTAGVNNPHIARDDACLFQRADATPAGRGGHRGAVGKILVRDTPVALDHRENPSVLICQSWVHPRKTLPVVWEKSGSSTNIQL
ncbi:hypothetical protein GALL_399320 [mine drainage metagenome]|uniref:Uncharacterized protein n=1 Tax=mine drainage metagenome TaxID=410659 RepID=A0A1J5QR11_9ZZZZ